MRNTSLNNRLFFNKYKIKKIVYKTSLSSIYEGINIKDNEPVAIKLEKNTSKMNLLESEAFFLFYLKGYGIPKIITYGKSGTLKVLVQELLGSSIHSLWESKKRYKNDNKLLIKDVCMIALQGIERIEYIHSKSIIHRDIKPLNFLIGKNNPETIYLIDFGFARKYRSSRTGKHIKYKWIKCAYGSFRYYSINANKGYELSRRDDLESFGYMLVYLSTQYLPWISTEKLKLDKSTKFHTIYKIKNTSTPETLCKDLPEEFADFVKYTRNLEFEEEPNYDYLKSLFANVLLKNQQKNDLNFFWIVKNGKKEKEASNIQENKTKEIKRHNSKNRLYNKIKLSLERANIERFNSARKNNGTKITDKHNNNNETENEDDLDIKTYDIKINKENFNNKLENKKPINNYKAFDLDQNNKCKKIKIDIIKCNDKNEEYEFNLKKIINEKKYYFNDDINRPGLYNKKILINHVRKSNSNEKSNKNIDNQAILNFSIKRIKIMNYKTIEERQRLNSLDNKNKNNVKNNNLVNHNNFNKIVLEKIKEKRINTSRENKTNINLSFKNPTENKFKRKNTYNIINYKNSKYNIKSTDEKLLSFNNNNYTNINPFLAINKKRKNYISPINKKNNKRGVESSSNIHQYF